MTDIAQIVHELGGMAQKRQLVARGARDIDLTNAVRSGEVLRARNGWYSTLSAGDERFRAVRVGGRLTGISAIAAMGGWVLGARPLHVSVPINASRLRGQWNRRRRLGASKTVVVHWDERATTGSATIVGLADALVQVALNESLEDTVAAFDWALHERLIEQSDFEAILLRLPEKLRFIADWVDAECESLPESLSRTRLRLAGHRVVSQVVLQSGERIDLLVDDCIGVEVDGEHFHRDRFFPDRDKDLRITQAGFHGIRPAAQHVFNDWTHVEEAVEVALAERGRPRRGNSGLAAGVARRAREMARPRRRSRRATPEFPKRTTAG